MQLKKIKKNYGGTKNGRKSIPSAPGKLTTS
jgi:hypothetical protein